SSGRTTSPRYRSAYRRWAGRFPNIALLEKRAPITGRCSASRSSSREKCSAARVGRRRRKPNRRPRGKPWKKGKSGEVEKCKSKFELTFPPFHFSTSLTSSPSLTCSNQFL